MTNLARANLCDHHYNTIGFCKRCNESNSELDQLYVKFRAEHDKAENLFLAARQQEKKAQKLWKKCQKVRTDLNKPKEVLKRDH